MWTWARFDDNGFEVSTAGNLDYSALVAKLNDGRTIEEAYQLDVKGYRVAGNCWRLGKGKPPLREGVDLWSEYYALWRLWARQHPEMLKLLSIRARGKVLTDRFATSEVNQAHALAELLNTYYGA